MADEKRKDASLEESTSPAQRQSQSLSVLQFQREMYLGPLPHPAILEEYERIVPGSAERIIRQAEQQTAHRISIESAVIESDISRSKWGLWLGFILSVMSIGGGTLLVGLGHDAAGATIATSGVAALAGVFIYGTAARRSERRESAKRVPPSREASDE